MKNLQLHKNVNVKLKKNSDAREVFFFIGRGPVRKRTFFEALKKSKKISN